jgi:hypothetical protein
MNIFTDPAGSIVELIGHDSPHCGVVLDEHLSIELIAFRNDQIGKMICKLILIDLRQVSNHPVTNKPPSYKLRQLPNFPWTKSQLRERIKKLKPKYEGQEYHLIYKNCQHFAWELATGVEKSPDADKFSPIGEVIGWMMNFKDFGSANSSASLADVKPLQDNLWSYLGNI